MDLPVRREQLKFSCDRNINSKTELDITTLDACSDRTACYLWTTN